LRIILKIEFLKLLLFFNKRMSSDRQTSNTDFVLYLKPMNDCKLTEEYYQNVVFNPENCGFDVYCVKEQVIPPNSISNKIHLNICVEAVKETIVTTWIPMYDLGERALTNITKTPQHLLLLPRSSTGLKTPLRLSNSIGVIDAGYRGELIAVVDNVSSKPFTINAGERYFQLCSSNLEPITCRIVKELSETDRNEKGFGSSGQ